MFDAMLRGCRAQQKSRGLRDETAGDRERLIRRFHEFTNEFPWQWTPGHMDEWSACLTGERHMAPSTIRAYQGDVRLFTEFLTDARYGWGPACEEAFARARRRSAMSGTPTLISKAMRVAPFYAILSLPVLPAVGMCLFDTVDGCF
jgi:Phage integrase, N-terminal SAM-like domain